MKQNKDRRAGVWVTPKEFFEPLRAEFNLQVDAAASKSNAMLPDYFTEKKSAFEQNWSGIRAWCNPPYGREIYKWIELCATSSAAVVVMLLPARTDTKWFHNFIYKNPRAEIRFIKGRIKFSGEKSAGKFPSMVVIFK